MGSDNDITIQCTMKYKTRDEEHENSARLSQILVDGDTVISQGSYTGMVGPWQAHEAIGKPQRVCGRHTRLSASHGGSVAGTRGCQSATVGQWQASMAFDGKIWQDPVRSSQNWTWRISLYKCTAIFITWSASLSEGARLCRNSTPPFSAELLRRVSEVFEAHRSLGDRV